jgi:hypothetical protein
VACNLYQVTQEVSVLAAVFGDPHDVDLVSTRSLQSVYLCREMRNLLSFQNYDDLKYVVLPEGLTSVGDNAFCGYSSLASAILPEGLISVGDNAFEGCSSLRL